MRLPCASCAHCVLLHVGRVCCVWLVGARGLSVPQPFVGYAVPATGFETSHPLRAECMRKIAQHSRHEAPMLAALLRRLQAPPANTTLPQRRRGVAFSSRWCTCSASVADLPSLGCSSPDVLSMPRRPASRSERASACTCGANARGLRPIGAEMAENEAI
jgi:hypothetical protein